MSQVSANAALGAASANVQSELDRLLDERARLTALQSLDPTGAELSDAIGALDRKVGSLLQRWKQAGGVLRLDGPRRSSAPIVSGRRPDLGSPVVTRTRRVAAPAVQSAVDPDWRNSFGQLIARLGPGQDLAGEIDIVVEAAVGCDQWSRWPRHVQRHLVGLLACRLRALQDEQGVPEYELQDGFSALTRFSKRAKPGFVFGLSRSHRPQHGESWDDDAVRHWDQLAALLPGDVELTDDQEELLDQLTFLADEVADAPSDDARETVRSQAMRMLGDILEEGLDARHPALVGIAMSLRPLPQTRPFMRLRHALSDAAAPHEDHGDSLEIAPEWGWWHHTRDRRGLIVGGRSSDETRSRLEQAFGMAGLRWTDETSGRRLLAGGGVDILFVFGRTISDSVIADLLPLAHARKVPVVHVDHGTSVAVVKSAIERFTEREGEATL